MRILDLKRIRIWRELGRKIDVNDILSDELQFAFWSLPIVKGRLITKVNKIVLSEKPPIGGNFFIRRIRHVRKITRMNLATSKNWVEHHFGR